MTLIKAASTKGVSKGKNWLATHVKFALRISIWWVNSLPSGSWFVNWPTLEQINELVVNSWSHNLSKLWGLERPQGYNFEWPSLCWHAVLCLTALSRSPTALPWLLSTQFLDVNKKLTKYQRSSTLPNRSRLYFKKTAI